MLFAHITDLHATARGTKAVRGRVDTNERLDRTIAHLNAMRPSPDFVIVTGDLTNGPLEGEYDTVAAAFARLDVPAYAIPGNHDRRDGMRQVFAGAPWLPPADQPFLHYAIACGDLTLLMLDTLVDGKTPGALDGGRLAWVEAELARHTGPVVIAMHHPPFDIGVPSMDALGCAGGDALAALIRRHGQVQLVLCGHVHRTVVRPYAGTIGMTLAAVAHQIAPDFDMDARRSPHFTLEAPAIAVHLWTGGGGLVTHVIEPGMEPQPFR